MFGWIADTARADIRLPKLFSDSMVLQRQAETPLYGMADAGEELTITVTGNGIEKKELKTICDVAGNFSLKLPAPPVGGPYEMEIAGTSSTVRIRDIMVGDVWLCAGQSNMEMTVASTASAKSVAQTPAIASLRLMTVERIASPRPLDEFTGAVSWAVASPEAAAAFSAVGYHFGRDLQQSQQVPIGMVNASWGGTLCEAWTSQATLKANDQLKELYEFGQTNLEGIQKQDQHGALFNGMISPLGRFPIKGVIWYQGESNVGRGAQYATLFPTLIQDWRQHFGSSELPFLFVHLAPFRYEGQSPEALAEIWDAQLQTLKGVPHTGMVVTTDVGNFTDIHPQDKETVGKRLADWAVAEVYNNQTLIDYPTVKSTTEENGEQPGQERTGDVTDDQTQFVFALCPIVDKQDDGKQEPSKKTAAQEADSDDEDVQTDSQYASPIYKVSEVEGDKVVVYFYSADGLRSGDGEKLREFEVAGEDQVFYPADAEVVGETVVVTSEKVSQPVAVRFAFNDTPNPNLVNLSGLPASPFRTDTFPLQSADRDY